jgi:hypothetical protein
MNTTTVFDKDRASSIARTYGGALRRMTDEIEEEDMWEIRLNFEAPMSGRVDVTWLGSDGRGWSADPYIEEDASLTAAVARSMARTLEIAALLVDELNGTEAA